MRKKLGKHWNIALMSVFMLIINVVNAQQLSEEPVGGMEESTVEEAPVNLPPSSSILPAEMNFSPLNTFYSSWDTLYVRRYSDPLPSVTDSILLPLIPDGTGNFVFPSNGQLLSPFGYRGRRVHAGVDLKLNLHDTVVSAFDGVVRMARYYAGYGNCVVIRHYNGLETLYGHLSRIKVKVNQVVQAGDLIGLGGSTGRASCNHLHFETRFRGQAFNPKQLIDFEHFSLLQDTLVITAHTFGRTRDYLPGLNKTTETDIDKTVSGKSKSTKGSKKYHTIRSGDTLYAISRKYGTSVKQICALNGIKSTKVLKLGTKLRIK
ncbi:MAG: peptidoglycan DD-metalloendopeptidase family protein [Bacteroidales bacterium]|nr:peptidoglycan DD-metalloendopeptidase family protein [Bacteroidales bacterium]